MCKRWFAHLLGGACYIPRVLGLFYSHFVLVLLVVCVFVFFLPGKMASVTVLTADWWLNG